MKNRQKCKSALILSIILIIDQICSPSMSSPIHTNESIHPAALLIDDKSESIRPRELLIDDKTESVPEQRAPVSGAVVEGLTRRILGKEIELERLNTLFRQKTTVTSNWRQRRMFAYGEGNAAITLSGLLLALPSLYQVADKKIPPGSKEKPGSSPSQMNNTRAATRLYLIANAYGAGGDVLELGLNFINYCSLRKKGFTPSLYRKQVHRLHAEIDNLIKQRRLALTSVSDFSVQDKKLAEAEGKLLSDLRDLYLTEYLDYHAGCKRFWLVQNGAYLTDFVKNATGGVGNIIGLQAYHLHNPALFGGEGLMTLISGAIILVVPLVGRVTGNISGLAARRIVSQEAADVHTFSADTYAADFNSFLAMKESPATQTYYATAAFDRRPLYEDQEKNMLMRNQFLKKEQKDARNTLIENIIFAGIVGPTKMTNGTLTMIAGWHYRDHPINASRLYAAGTTAYAVGSAFSVLETARLAAEFEWSNWKLRNSDLLPSNQFNRRLRMLDNMDSFLNK